MLVARFHLPFTPTPKITNFIEKLFLLIVLKNAQQVVNVSGLKA
jgi:hypothetical protein